MIETVPLRILHLIPSLDPAGGGPAQGVRNITACYGALGAVPTIASLDAPDAPWLDLGHVRAIGLGPGRGGTFSYAPRLLPWLHAQAGSFDAAVVHGLWQYPGVAARRALRAAGVPYFVYPHGMLDPWFRHEYPLKHVKKCLYWWLAQHAVLRDAAAVLFTCEEERRLARESFWPYRVREAVVNYGTTLPADVRPEQRDAFLGAFPALRGQRLLLFLGRIHEKKGCDLLIDAFADAAGREGALHLVMAGPDQTGWQADLQRRATDRGVAGRITWTGMLTGDLKWGALQAAEAFVLPSHQENFGIAVAEALAVGTPVLISDKVNIWREIDADGAGLVAPDTRDGTASLLQRWLDMTPDARRQMGERARECFAQRFEMRRAVENLLGVIRARYGNSTDATTALARKPTA
ncbi:MAG TPA: glycosyltransferase [Candidatus Acidoferrales bacterium]|nr:glycosyltransferase [Candidatus Acidoferrales bacterium]